MTFDEIADELRKSDMQSDIWHEACSAAGLTTEMMVPITKQRHLIGSWSGVATGVNILTKRLQRYVVSLLEAITERDAKINELNAKLEKSRQDTHAVQLENIQHRVVSVLAGRKDASPELIACVSSEIGT